jgi:general secretion pathway protein B
MSFILDALKKSEAERQRQTGPTLLELRITHPRRRYPIWALALGGLLAVNAVVLLIVALHRPSAPGGNASAAATAPSPPAALAASPAIAALPAGSAGSAPVAPAPAPVAAVPAASTPVATAVPAAPAAAVPPLADSAASPTANSATPPHNPADDEPAVARTQPTTSADFAALPTLASLGDQVPALQLNMLVSSSRPADRYALINMHRVREGDVLPEGARVLAITSDGVAMEYHGQDFLLPRGAAPPPAQ